MTSCLQAKDHQERYNCWHPEDTALQPRNVKHFVCSSSQTDLHSKDESLIDTKGLLRSDQQRGDAGKRAREEQALIVNLSDNSAVRAIKHPVRECTDTIPSRHKYNSISLSEFCTYFCFFRTVQCESWRNSHVKLCAYLWEQIKPTVLTCLFGVWGLSLEPSVTHQSLLQD